MEASKRHWSTVLEGSRAEGMKSEGGKRDKGENMEGAGGEEGIYQADRSEDSVVSVACTGGGIRGSLA